MPGFYQGGKMFEKQGTDQRGDMQPIGIGIGQAAVGAKDQIAQARFEPQVLAGETGHGLDQAGIDELLASI